jgi:hypothetical protein
MICMVCTHSYVYITKKKKKVHGTKKFKKLKNLSEGTSVPLGKEKKTITSGEGGRDLRGKVDGEGG